MGEAERAVRMMGAWADFEGAIYQSFNPLIHGITLDEIYCNDGDFQQNVQHRGAISGELRRRVRLHPHAAPYEAERARRTLGERVRVSKVARRHEPTRREAPDNVEKFEQRLLVEVLEVDELLTAQPFGRPLAARVRAGAVVRRRRVGNIRQHEIHAEPEQRQQLARIAVEERDVAALEEGRDHN
jgi:hypothetical protein